jgi:hypothetical protein
MTQKSARGMARGWRRGRGVGGKRIDAYHWTVKPAGSARCPDCGAVWKRGRWTWAAAATVSTRRECPACRRVRDCFPAGWIRLEGSFREDETEILGMIRNIESAEKADHPLERLMEISDHPWGILVTTTGIHLARRIAEALRRRWHEGVEIDYVVSQDLVRVTWKHAPARGSG